MALSYQIYGSEDGVPILMAHGLFGQGRNLGALARRLAERRQVVVVDMRNHGDSFHSANHGYAALAGDLAGVIEILGGRADVVGHSMGGKAAMVLALTRPECVRKLVVMDIAPVSYGHSQAHLIDAMESLDLAAINRRSLADAALSHRIDNPGIRAFLLQSLDLKAALPRWKMNLTALREQMDGITGWPSGLPKGRFSGPTLALAGECSDYVTDAGQAALRAYFPQAKLVRVKGAGHWLHADAPGALADTLSSFLGAG